MTKCEGLLVLLVRSPLSDRERRENRERETEGVREGESETSVDKSWLIIWLDCNDSLAGFMQRSVSVVLLPLFLILVVAASLFSCCDSDFHNSVSKSRTLLDSVMAPKRMMKRMKRMLEQCTAENYESGETIGQGGGKSNRDFFREDHFARVNSKRWKTVSQQQVGEGLSEFVSINTFEHCQEQFRGDDPDTAAVGNENASVISVDVLPDFDENSSSECSQMRNMRGQCSQLFGQAFYQKSRQGLVVTYEDSGDNIYTCDFCNARFWSGEAIKRSSSNAPFIYTNCCKKGQIKIQQSKPAPTFLENLLDPNNGPESNLFRENIRVYNSMFSFTSKGVTIDHKINTGSGPYVFKISGQVHHLMGSVLPSDGKSPKYAQLYIYDTKNEVTNRISAIDPNHVNENVRLNIVEGLIKMFDETNELVKEFRTIRDKYESCLCLY